MRLFQGPASTLSPKPQKKAVHLLRGGLLAPEDQLLRLGHAMVWASGF